VEYTPPVTQVRQLIVTTQAMKQPFQRLAEWRTRTGVPARVETMDSVLASAAGADAAERLRNFLKDYRASHPELAFVLLGGDASAVPARVTYVWTDTYDQYYTSANAPVEFYYEDLDGDWDADGDGQYGQIDDGLDMQAEVSVGRLPADSVAEAQVMVDKLLQYERDPTPGYLSRVILLSEDTGYFGVDSSVLLEKWAEKLIPASFDLVKLYDNAEQYDDADYNTAGNEITALEQGAGLVVHLGHGTEGMLSQLDVSQVRQLSNAPRFPLYVSCACYAGNFDSGVEDSAGEEWLLNEDGGGVAYLGNTDIGIGFPPGQAFLDHLLRGLLLEGRTRLGDAWFEARRSFTPEADERLFNDGDPYRYTMFVVDLLGDPGMDLYTREPGALDVAFFAGPWLEVTVRDAATASPVAGADVSCALADGTVHLVASDSAGVARLRLPGDLSFAACNLTVRAHDFRPFTQDASL
jgi:hypothetical protein